MVYLIFLTKPCYFSVWHSIFLAGWIVLSGNILYQRRFNYCHLSSLLLWMFLTLRFQISLPLNMFLAESEHGFCNEAMSHEPEYNDNALDSIGLKSGNGFVKEIESGKLSYLKGMEGDADRLTNIAPVPSHSSPKMEPFKESVFYMDKSVMERELPELIVCYKENTYHVKDICVDEGAPLQDKFLFDTDAQDRKSVV